MNLIPWCNDITGILPNTNVTNIINVTLSCKHGAHSGFVVPLHKSTPHKPQSSYIASYSSLVEECSA